MNQSDLDAEVDRAIDELADRLALPMGESVRRAAAEALDRIEQDLEDRRRGLDAVLQAKIDAVSTEVGARVAAAVREDVQEDIVRVLAAHRAELSTAAAERHALITDRLHLQERLLRRQGIALLALGGLLLLVLLTHVVMS